MNFKVWLENFNTPSDLFLNPENNNKPWNELIDEFEKSGGEILGVGRYAQVLHHPNWNYVLKTFSHDSLYVPFARFAYRNPHPSFPKFFGQPQRVKPNYLRYKEQTFIFLVRIEKLKPIDPATFKLIENWIWAGERHMHNRKNPNFKGDPKLLNILKERPELESVFEGWSILMRESGLQGASDINQTNFMMRDNGQIVISDPFWEGSNPYADARESDRMNTDYYGDMEYEEPNVVGGKFPKKKKIKKWNPPVRSQVDDEVPF